MTPQVLIPWQDTGCPHRQAAMGETCRHWVEDHRYPIRVSTLGRGVQWCKALALAPAIAAATTPVIIIADADCLIPTQAVLDCVRAVEGGAPWAIPHWSVVRLTRAATERLYDRQSDVGSCHTVEQAPYVGCATGGVVIIRLDVALSVPMDGTYRDWGGEDYSWGFALDTLVGGPYRPLDHHDLTHLYHPRHPRAGHGTNLSSDEDRRRAYFSAWAASDKDAMRRLVEGGRLWPAQSPSS